MSFTRWGDRSVTSAQETEARLWLQSQQGLQTQTPVSCRPPGENKKQPLSLRTHMCVRACVRVCMYVMYVYTNIFLLVPSSPVLLLLLLFPLCSPGCPGAQAIDQVGLELRDPFVSTPSSTPPFYFWTESHIPQTHVEVILQVRKPFIFTFTSLPPLLPL